MILALHTLSICFGTGLNVWIFSKMFPKKENWCWKEILCEVILGILFLLIILQIFAKNMSTAVKGVFFFAWISGILFYRYGVENNKKGNKYAAVLNSVILYLEFGLSAGLLMWNAWTSYISVPAIMLGNIFMPFSFLDISNAAGSKAIFGHCCTKRLSRL